jgi:hypothetical protein
MHKCSEHLSGNVSLEAVEHFQSFKLHLKLAIY